MNASCRRTEQTRKEAQERDPRFRQLLALAEAGDECAAADLFKEFDYVFQGGEEGSGHVAD